MEDLRKARIEHNLDRRMKVHLAPRVLVVGRVRHLALRPGVGHRLSSPWWSARYGRGSIILTSNKGFGEWGELLGDTVIASLSWTGCCTTAVC